jgi:hypothetical protein
MSEVKVLTYRELISQPETKLKEENLDQYVKTAEAHFKAGLNSLELQLITRNGVVLSCEAALEAAFNKEKSILISSSPEILVQSIVNARTEYLQAEVNLQGAKDNFQKIQDMYEYLVDLQHRLFPPITSGIKKKI